MAIYTNTAALELARTAELEAEALATSQFAQRAGANPFTLGVTPRFNDPQFVGATQTAEAALQVQILLREQPQGQISPPLA